MNPYDLKFARAGDGVRFKLPVPGGPNATIGGCRSNVYDPRRCVYLVIWLFGYLVISVWAISMTSCFVYRVGKTDAGAVGSVKLAPVSNIVTKATVRVTP